MEEDKKIDIFDPGIIIAIIFGFIGDAAMLVGVLAVAIPAIGIVIAGFAVLAHYISAIVVIVIFWRHIRGWLACLVLLFVGILPLPLLAIGIVAAILLSNKAIAFIAEQAVIQTVAVFTAGAGEALEAGAAAETTATAAEEAAQAGKAVAAGEKAAETVEKGSRAAKQAQRGINVANRLENMKEGSENNEEESEREMELEAERPPEEVEERELFEQMPGTRRGIDKEDENGQTKLTDQNNRTSNLVSGAEFQKRAEEIKQKQEKLPKMIDIREEDENDHKAAA